MNRFEKLYYKILDNEDWEMEDLDCLLSLARQEGVDSCKVAPVSVSTVQDCELTMRITAKTAVRTLSDILTFNSAITPSEAVLLKNEFRKRLSEALSLREECLE